MDISKIRTVACVHSSHRRANRSPHIQLNSTTTESFLSVEGYYEHPLNRVTRDKYYFSRCALDADCRPEIEDLVHMTLEGYNTSAIFMSTGPSDPFDQRQETIHQLLVHVDERLRAVNELKQRRGQQPIMLDYAFLGVTDDFCYDLRTDRKLKNSQILEHGLDSLMKRVTNTDQVWTKAKSGSRFPFLLKLRLSDDYSFLGTVTIVDLLFPWHQSSPTPDPSGIEYSFKKLQSSITSLCDPDFEALISTETYVLTKLVAKYFCGLCRTVVFMHINEYPENLVQDTLNALEFMQTLRSMRTIAILNEPDRRMTSMLKQKLAILEQNMEEEKARGSQLEVDLQQAMNRLGEKDIKVQQFEFQIDQLRFRDEARIDGLKNELKKTQDELESRKVEGAYYDSKRKAEYVGLVWEVNRSRTAHVQTKIDAQLKSLALEDFNATVSQLEGIVSSRDTILKDKDITIQSQQAELTNTRQEKEKLSQNLHRLGGTVSNLEQDIVQLKRTIHDLDRGRSELIKEVAELTAEKEHAKEETEYWKSVVQGKKSKLASMKATAAQQKMVIKALETRAQKAESSLAAASSQLDALSTLRKATASPALDMPQQSSAAPTDQSSVGARKVGKNDRTGALAVTKKDPTTDAAATNSPQPCGPSKVDQKEGPPSPSSRTVEATLELRNTRATRKRRKLVDPKKRVSEAYDDNLSPLSKVNQVLDEYNNS